MKQKPTNPAKISLANAARFFKGYSRYFSDAFGFFPLYKKEQVIWRSIQAAECTANKACLYCGCDTPGKYYGDEGCEDPQRNCYPEMMDEKTWEQYKIDNSITVNIE